MGNTCLAEVSSGMLKRGITGVKGDDVSKVRGLAIFIGGLVLAFFGDWPVAKP